MKDAAGNPDFKSAWDSVIEEVSIDTQSLKSFIELTKMNDCQSAIGLQDSTQVYNSFLILSGNIGSLRWAIFKLASGLQVLNSAISLSVGAKITESIPNLHVGILSMALMFQTKQELTSHKKSLIVEMISTISSLSKSPSIEVQHYMSEDNQVTPSDPIGKLFTVWYREDCRDSMLQQIMRELLGSVVQEKFGKQTLEKNIKYNSFIENLLDTKEFLKELECHPLDTSHWIEDKLVTSQKIYSFTVDQNQAEDEFDEGLNKSKKAYESLQKYLSSEQIIQKIKTQDELYRKFVQICQRFYAISKFDLTCLKDKKDIDYGLLFDLEDIDKIYPDSLSHYIEFLFLRKRSGRYNSVQVEKESELKKKVPSALYRPVIKAQQEIGSCESLLLEYLKTRYSGVLSERETRRTTEIKSGIITKFFRFLDDAEDSLTIQEVSEYLKNSFVLFEGRKFSLNRTDLAIEPDFYRKCAKKNRLFVIQEYLVGDWISDAASSVKSYIVTIEYMITQHFLKKEIDAVKSTEEVKEAVDQDEDKDDEFVIVGDDDQNTKTNAETWTVTEDMSKKNLAILAEILGTIGALEICKRIDGINRHGHCAENPFPGATGYSEKYYSLLKSKRGQSHQFTGFLARKLENMKLYTKLYEELRQVLDDPLDLRFLKDLAIQYLDPNLFPIIKCATFYVFYDKLMQYNCDLDYEILCRIGEKTQNEWSIITPAMFVGLKNSRPKNNTTVQSYGKGKIGRLIRTIYGKNI